MHLLILLVFLKTGFSQEDDGNLCLTTQLSIKDQTIKHVRGTNLGTVNVRNRAILEFNVTWGNNVIQNRWRNFLHIGNSESYRQPGLYLQPNNMVFVVGWNQDSRDFGQLSQQNVYLRENTNTNFRIETNSNQITAFVDGVENFSSTQTKIITDYGAIKDIDNQPVMFGSNYLPDWRNVDVHLTGIEYSTYEPCPTTTTTAHLFTEKIN